MTRGTLPMVEPKLIILKPEIFAKIGFDSPPAVPSLQDRPAQSRTKRHRLPRELREARRGMLYHWF